MGMKMAKASQMDLDTALKLLSILDAVDNGYVPTDGDGDDELEHFDRSNVAHLQAFYDQVQALLGRGTSGLSRVIWGFATILHNNVIDPDADTLEFHPRIRKALALLAAQGVAPAIGQDAARDGHGLAHRGFFHERTAYDQTRHVNRRETIFANSWENENVGLSLRQVSSGGSESLLSRLLSREEVEPAGRPGGGTPKEVRFGALDQNTAAVVATVVQWMGTNVGFGWLSGVLREAGYALVEREPA